MANGIPPAACQILLTLGRIGARAIAKGTVAIASSATKDLGEFLKEVGDAATKTADQIDTLGQTDDQEKKR